MSNWVVYAILAMLSFSVMILLFKKITLLHVRPATLMLYVALFLLLYYATHLLVTKQSPSVTSSAFMLLALAAFFSYFANLFYVKSIDLAPNAGYAASIVGLQALLITLGALLFFGAKLTLLKGAGVVLGVIAVILLSL